MKKACVITCICTLCWQKLNYSDTQNNLLLSFYNFRKCTNRNLHDNIKGKERVTLHSQIKANILFHIITRVVQHVLSLWGRTVRSLQVLIVGPKTEKYPNFDSKPRNQADNMSAYSVYYICGIYRGGDSKIIYIVITTNFTAFLAQAL